MPHNLISLAGMFGLMSFAWALSAGIFYADGSASILLGAVIDPMRPPP